MNLVVETFSVGPMDNNLYLLLDPSAKRGVIIDPSLASETALQRVRELQNKGILFDAIWNTHGHFDHIYENAHWKAALEIPLWMHRADEFLRSRLREQSLWFGFAPIEGVAPDHFFEPETDVFVGRERAEILHVPGHSPGSVAFYFPDSALCVSGDVLFAGSIGRTDLPGAAPAELQISLKTLLALPPQTQILPGHGPSTTVAQEIQTNPFCREIL